MKQTLFVLGILALGCELESIDESMVMPDCVNRPDMCGEDSTCHTGTDGRPECRPARASNMSTAGHFGDGITHGRDLPENDSAIAGPGAGLGVGGYHVTGGLIDQGGESIAGGFQGLAGARTRQVQNGGQFNDDSSDDDAAGRSAVALAGGQETGGVAQYGSGGSLNGDFTESHQNRGGQAHAEASGEVSDAHSGSAGTVDNTSGQACTDCQGGTDCNFIEACNLDACAEGICEMGRCGDDTQDDGEGCDDGNTITEDCAYGLGACTVCAADCTLQPGATHGCGDDTQDDGEGCDDGNTVTEDCAYGLEACTVCAADCTLQPGATHVCGDDTQDDGEACDDGNTFTEDCAYGLEACTVCAADCTLQPGATHVCGDDTQDDGEGCDDGNTVTETCLEDQGPCEVCNHTCSLVEGLQVPTPRIWDGEANDGRWETAANWHPDGVPDNTEWVVIGQNAIVLADRPRCRNVTIETGATLRHSHQVLNCAITVNGTFERIGGGVNPAGRSISIKGLFGSIPWIDTWNTAFVFYDGAEFGNPGMSFRVREGNSMTFVLSETGFTPLRSGAALDPNNWNDVTMTVDVSAYDLNNGSDIILWDFDRHDSIFSLVDEIELAVEDKHGRVDGRLFWDAVDSRLVLRLASTQALNDVEVTLRPQSPTVLTPIRASALTAHPTAVLRYRWFVNGEQVAGTTPVFEAIDQIARDAVITVEVFAETSGGRSESAHASTTVVNAPPTFDKLDIMPREPTVIDELTIDSLVVDLDPNDNAQLTGCVWQVWVDGWHDIDAGTALADCRTRDACAAGDIVRIRCQATDGLDISDEVASAPVTLLPDDCHGSEPRCLALSTVPTVDELDYGFWYWPTNQRPRDRDTWPTYRREMHFLTGHYGMVFDEAAGNIVKFGPLDDGLTMSAGRLRTNAVVEGLPDAQIRWSAGTGENRFIADRFLGDDGDASGGIARLSEAGRFMNRIDLPQLRYGGHAHLRGLVEIASMPRHVTFTHEVSADHPSESSSAASIHLSRSALTSYDKVEWLLEGRALRMTDGEGAGWLFVVYDRPNTTTTISLGPDELVAQRVSEQLTAKQSISLLASPVSALNEAETEMFIRPSEAVSIEYGLLNLSGDIVRGDVSVTWDESLGAYRVDLGSLDEAGIGQGRNYDVRPDLHNWYGRHQLRVDTHGQGPIAVPIAFYSNQRISQSITSGVALFRDEQGLPIGVPIQMSKNWHDPTTGQWYRLYSQPVFSGMDVRPLELTMVSSRWGDSVYAASHAQLSLIGWNGGVAHWDESALGAFGESITYNPDQTYRSMVDDVRPFLVQAQDTNGRWNWTGNVGGADFLQFYSQTDQPNWPRQLSRMRTTYRSHGPNLTDVLYSGISLGGAIHADITVQMGRTDDLVRTWYHFDYTFLENVQYDRLAFFQMAADKYSDNGYARLAWGNANGVVEDRAVLNHQTTGYADNEDRGIPLEGPSPWVMLYDNQWTTEELPEHYADLAYVVRDFEANIGGTVITTPHINLHRTNNRVSQIGFELGLPFEANAAWCGPPCNGQRNFIPAGSTVRATIEYLVPPADKGRYYGESDYLTAMPNTQWRTTAMALDLAVGNHLSLESSIGQIRRIQPVEIDAAQGAVAAQFTLTGGLGYVPITVHGLMRHDGWQLQKRIDNEWVAVDQSVHGNDFWQALFNGNDDTYSISWNIPNRDVQTYRVFWVP